jgi:hypothetical protein
MSPAFNNVSGNFQPSYIFQESSHTIDIQDNLVFLSFSWHKGPAQFIKRTTRLCLFCVFGINILPPYVTRFQRCLYRATHIILRQFLVKCENFCVSETVILTKLHHNGCRTEPLFVHSLVEGKKLPSSRSGLALSIEPKS